MARRVTKADVGREVNRKPLSHDEEVEKRRLERLWRRGQNMMFYAVCEIHAKGLSRTHGPGENSVRDRWGHGKDWA
jgi:hypothetical protein